MPFVGHGGESYFCGLSHEVKFLQDFVGPVWASEVRALGGVMLV